MAAETSGHDDEHAAVPAGQSLTMALRERVPFAGQLGVELIDASASSVKARLEWTPALSTDVATLHGGALMGLADLCGGICAGLNLPPGSIGTTTIESKTNFFRPVRSGHAEAVAEPLHIGRTTMVIQTDVFGPDGRRAARVIQTQAVLQPPGP